jgi:1,4-dihydroxy-2-naphthoate octaprenyltransferase
VATVGVVPAPGSARAWWLAARPRTLTVSLAPVAVGTAAAAAEGEAAALPALAALGGALLLQIGANCVNDYADFRSGADARGRLGPPRAAQQGWLSVSQLRAGAGAAFALATALGVYLVWRGGPPIAVMGALALGAAWAYTSGPALGYRGLGDVLVFVFFGLFAVVGTTVVQAGHASALSGAAAVPVGLLATLLLAVNNLRDLEGDARAGKRTIAVRLGERAARRYAQGLLLGSYAALPAVARVAGSAWPALLPLLALPIALPLLGALARDRGAALNASLARAARLALVFGLLLAAGLVL